MHNIFVTEDTQSDPDDDASVPNTITTKADVEAEPSDCQISLPDDSLHSPELKSPSESKHSCNADFSNDSQEHLVTKVKKPRHKAQRAKSALESSSLPSKHSTEKRLRSRPSLPAKPKLDSVINKDTGVSIIRPWSDQTICRTKKLLESDEIFVIGHEVMNRNVPNSSHENKSDKVSLNNSKGRPRCSAISSYSSWPLHRGRSSDTSDKASQSNVIQEDDEKCNSEVTTCKVDTEQNSDMNNECKNVKECDFNKDNSIKRFTRNAISEERTVNSGMNVASKTSSQPSMKVSRVSSSSFSDSDSDLSLGEVFVPPENSNKAKIKTDKKAKKRTKDKSNVKMRSKQDKSDKKPRPISAEFVKSNSFHSGTSQSSKTKMKIHSSPTLNSSVNQGCNGGTPEKPKDIGFARVTKMLARAASERLSNDRAPSSTSVTNSQQSSVIGIDWLFGTDSDSTGKSFLRNTQTCFGCYQTIFLPIYSDD